MGMDNDRAAAGESSIRGPAAKAPEGAYVSFADSKVSFVKDRAAAEHPPPRLEDGLIDMTPKQKEERCDKPKHDIDTEINLNAARLERANAAKGTGNSIGVAIRKLSGIIFGK